MFLFHNSSVVSSTVAEEAIPAFETRMSTPPYSRAVVAKAALTCDSSVTSIITSRTLSLPCVDANCLQVSLSRALSMSARTTQAPSVRNRSAVADPMPPAPPVTNATRPARLLGFGMRCSLASSNSQYSISKASCSGRPQYSETADDSRMTLMALV